MAYNNHDFGVCIERQHVTQQQTLDLRLSCRLDDSKVVGTTLWEFARHWQQSLQSRRPLQRVRVS
ncbi:MAG: hypothetical protein V4794_08735 [Pseudomonadota bacterium]